MVKIEIIVLIGIILILITLLIFQQYSFCEDILYINDYHQEHTKELIVEIIPIDCQFFR